MVNLSSLLTTILKMMVIMENFMGRFGDIMGLYRHNVGKRMSPSPSHHHKYIGAMVTIPRKMGGKHDIVFTNMFMDIKGT